MWEKGFSLEPVRCVSNVGLKQTWIQNENESFTNYTCHQGITADNPLCTAYLDSDRSSDISVSDADGPVLTLSLGTLVSWS